MTNAPAPDRRRSERVAPAELPPGTTVRLRAGHEAEILNVSRHGVFLETPTRLNPGQRCCLQWLGPHVARNTGGVVVRAHVAHRDARFRLVYRAAIDFTEPLGHSWEGMTRPGNGLLASAEASRLAVGTTFPGDRPRQPDNDSWQPLTG